MVDFVMRFASKPIAFLLLSCLCAGLYADEVGPFWSDQLVDWHKQDVDISSKAIPNFNWDVSIDWSLEQEQSRNKSWSYSISFTYPGYAEAKFGGTEGDSGTETFTMSGSVPPVPRDEYNLCACNVHKAWWGMEAEIMKKYVKEQYWYTEAGSPPVAYVTTVVFYSYATRASKYMLTHLQTYDYMESCYGMNNYPLPNPWTKNWHYHYWSASDAGGHPVSDIGKAVCIADVQRRGGI